MNNKRCAYCNAIIGANNALAYTDPDGNAICEGCYEAFRDFMSDVAAEEGESIVNGNNITTSKQAKKSRNPVL